MESIHKLENTIAGWYKQLPFHIPANIRKWLAENLWWLVIIGVVLGILGIITSLQAIFIASSYSNLLPYAVASGLGTTLTVSIWINIAMLLIMVAIEAMAVSPLKQQKKWGWDLMFLLMLLSAVLAVVSSILSMNILGLFPVAIGLVIGGFVLFEIRSNFISKTSGSGPIQPKN